MRRNRKPETGNRKLPMHLLEAYHRAAAFRTLRSSDLNGWFSVFGFRSPVLTLRSPVSGFWSTLSGFRFPVSGL